MTDQVCWQGHCAVSWLRGVVPWNPALLAVLLVAVAGTVESCGPKPRDADSMVWSRADWDPRQEAQDIASCTTWGAKAAFRKHFWQRSAIAKEIENPTPSTDPGTLTDKLRVIAIKEKASAMELTEDCMNELGYKYVPINKARW
ncbi:MAG: hypothetical protein HQL64_17420 [Magnetococcales bacterium]|nr:hypothetical protein [Magnetococcales bacterium]